jgi:hypothetical protein
MPPWTSISATVSACKRGGIIAASVWEFKGGLTFRWVMADTAAVLDVEGEAFRAKQFSSRLR